jgi:hypothetical protein
MNKNLLLLISLGLALILITPLVGCTPAQTPTTPIPPSTPAQTPSQSSQGQQPIEVISVLDTTKLVNGEINPGGPTIKITLKNVSHKPVVSLNVTMDEGGPRSFDFDFNVTPSNPFQPNESISSERRLIGGGFGGDLPYGNFPYSLTINGTMQSGETFAFTWEPPASSATPTQSSGPIPTSAGWTTYTTDDGLSSNITTSVIQDKQGVIWVSSTQGLTRYDGNHWEVYTDSLGDIHISCSARDKQDSLWFGTGREGAYEYTETGWRSFNPGNTDKGLPGEQIVSILVDNRGNIWFATVGNVGQRTAPIPYGVTRYNGTDWTSYLDRTNVTTIFQDNQDNLWFGTNVGVIRYDGSNWQTFTTENGLVDNYVIAICQDNQGNMWFGTWADGVSRYDGKEWRTFYPEDGLMSDAIHCMLKDSKGNLWFGSYSIDGYYGISRFDGTQWQHFDPWQGKNDNKYHYNVISIFEDNEGNIWFATSIGLVRYYPE